MNLRTRIKICGITRVQDAVSAIEAGVDAIGLVFYPKSSRNVSLQQAEDIMKSVPAFVTVTALFVDPRPSFVESVLDEIQPDLLQFHGNEKPEFCEQFNRPYIKAVRMQQETCLIELSRVYSSSRGLLLDTYVKGVPGGTGASFNWDWVAKDARPEGILPLILAGGLTEKNVVQGIDVVKPWAVDVSGGVEDSPGKKSSQKIEQFINAVNLSL